MITDELVRSLAAIPVPNGVEEWLQPSEAVQALPAHSDNQHYQRGVRDILGHLVF